MDLVKLASVFTARQPHRVRGQIFQTQVAWQTLMLMANRLVSFDEPLRGQSPDHDDLKMVEVLRDESPSPEELAARRDLLAYLLGKLTRRERKMVIQRVVHERLLEDIGEEWGLSRERVRQIVDRALQQMRFELELLSWSPRT